MMLVSVYARTGGLGLHQYPAGTSCNQRDDKYKVVHNAPLHIVSRAPFQFKHHIFICKNDCHRMIRSFCIIITGIFMPTIQKPFCTMSIFRAVLVVNSQADDQASTGNQRGFEQLICHMPVTFILIKQAYLPYNGYWYRRSHSEQ